MAENENNTEPTFEELMQRADNGELKSTDLQYIVQEYGRSVREEFEIALKDKPDNAEEAKRDFCRNHLAQSLADIQWLAKNADSESVRLNAAKFIVEGAVRESTKDGDPIKQILANLMAAPEDSPHIS